MTTEISLRIQERYEQLKQFVGAQLCENDWAAMSDSIASDFDINRNTATRLVNEWRESNKGCV